MQVLTPSHRRVTLTKEALELVLPVDDDPSTIVCWLHSECHHLPIEHVLPPTAATRTAIQLGNGVGQPHRAYLGRSGTAHWCCAERLEEARVQINGLAFREARNVVADEPCRVGGVSLVAPKRLAQFTRK
jgi:hypothetical protein